MVKLNKKGFTLAELLIVVAVIAVLVAVAIPTFNNQLEKSRQGVDVSNLRGAFAAARLAQIDQGVGTARFKDAVANDGGLQYWYNPDSGSLTQVNEEEETAADAVSGGYAAYGKATGANLMADTSQLPGGGVVKYNGNTLKESTLPTTKHTGTVDKAILVKFMEDGNNKGTYIIYKITFVEAAGTTGEPTITALAVKLAGNPGKDTDNAIELKDNLPYNLATVLTVTGTDDTGEPVASPSVEYVVDGSMPTGYDSMEVTTAGAIAQKTGETLPSSTVDAAAVGIKVKLADDSVTSAESASVYVKYTVAP